MLDAGVVITSTGCQEKEELIGPRYCQIMRGWIFLLLLARCWLLDELGVQNKKELVKSRDSHFCPY